VEYIESCRLDTFQDAQASLYDQAQLPADAAREPQGQRRPEV
jgi:hypothetical protein